MKNLQLKAMIILKRGPQYRFAGDAGVAEATVSRVINGTQQLSEKEKARWAKLLKCQVSDIFPASEKNQ